jgi:vancomycin permeability regulator SanA
MILKLFIYVAIGGALVLLISRLVTTFYARPHLATEEEVLPERVAIVFGAGLWRDGSPTPVLRDRVASAAALFFAGKVEKLLMSGDNRFVDYNEPAAMRDYAVGLGVPAEAIVLDYAGRRTYDTCYRARDIFGLEKAILVTQPFHMPRALYICNQLGVEAQGVPATQGIYRRLTLLYWNLRELIATLVAHWEVHISQPLPVLGDPEPIFPIVATDPAQQGDLKEHHTH